MEYCFNPNEVEVLARVVHEACQKLGHNDDMTKENLAARVLCCAAQGERDFDKLLSPALNGKAVAHAA